MCRCVGCGTSVIITGGDVRMCEAGPEDGRADYKSCCAICRMIVNVARSSVRALAIEWDSQTTVLTYSDVRISLINGEGRAGRIIFRFFFVLKSI